MGISSSSRRPCVTSTSADSPSELSVCSKTFLAATTVATHSKLLLYQRVGVGLRLQHHYPIDNQRFYYEKSLQNLNDFLSGTPDSAFLNITHLNLSGLFVKLDATLIPHLRSLISLHLENILSTEDQASGNPGSSTVNINLKYGAHRDRKTRS